MADDFQNQTPQTNADANQLQQAVSSAMAEQKKKKKKKKLIILGVIVAIIVVIAIAAGGSGGSDDASTTAAGGTTVSADGGNTANDTSVDADKQEAAAGTIGDYSCTVKSAKVCKNWEGKDAVKITYEFTNNSDDAASFDIALNDEPYQDGVGLESTFISSDDDDWGIDVKIKPGTTKEVSKVYLLRDKKTPIEVEISELISLSDDKLNYTIKLD